MRDNQNIACMAELRLRKGDRTLLDSAGDLKRPRALFSRIPVKFALNYLLLLPVFVWPPCMFPGDSALLLVGS